MIPNNSVAQVPSPVHRRKTTAEGGCATLLRFVFIVIAALGLVVRPARAEPGGTPVAASGVLTLTENGACRAALRLRDGASAAEQYAATQLQEAFQLATGVPLELNPSQTAPLTIRLGVADATDKRLRSTSTQAYGIFCGQGAIELVGNSPAAALWAAMDFCERVLKVSWPDMGPPRRDGPCRATLRVEPFTTQAEPDLPHRGWHICSSEGSGSPHYHQGLVDWMAHNRMSFKLTHFFHLSQVGAKLAARGLEADTTAHSFAFLVPKKLFKEHPEYFPLIGGQRRSGDGVGTQLCVSNPEVARLMAAQAKEGFRMYPEMLIFGVTPNDGTEGWCECEACQAWDGAQRGKGIYSNRLVHLVNKVAEEVAGEFPQRFIGMHAYANYRDPPGFKLAPNVAVAFTTGGRNYLKPLTDPTDPANAAMLKQLCGWLNQMQGPRFLSLYEYYLSYGFDDVPPPIGRTLVEEFAKLKALGVKGAFSEMNAAYWSSCRLFAYVFAQSLWNTRLDFERILGDYCRKLYGSAAAQEMIAYHLTYERAVRANLKEITISTGVTDFAPAFTPSLFAALDEHLKRAEEAARKQGESSIFLGALAEERRVLERLKALGQDPRDLPNIGANLLYNPGAEDGITATGQGWFSNIQEGEYVCDIDGTQAHSGKHSFRISATKAGWARWAQPLTVKKGHRYALSLWFCARGGASGLIWLHNNVSGTADDKLVSWTDTHGKWVRLVIPEFVAPSDGLMLFLENRSGGVVNFDDIFFAELPARNQP